MRMLYVNGRLDATVPSAVTVRTGSRISDAVMATASWSATNIPAWQNGTIEFDNIIFADEGDKSPMDFIARLNDMLWRVGLTELGLAGEITLVITGEDPVFMRVIVENSELRYQKANFQWEDPKTPES